MDESINQPSQEPLGPQGAGTDAGLARRVEGLEELVTYLRLEVRDLSQRLDAAAGTHVVGPSPDLRHTPCPEPLPRRTATPLNDLEGPEARPPRPGARRQSPLATPAASAEPTLERRIGGQVFAVAGSLIVLAGLALFVKLGVENGWFRFFSPTLRCLAIAGAGVALLGAGEFLRPRVRAIAVAGCNAAGVGALYIAAFAAHAVFGLIGSVPAFVLMTGSAALGLAVALRHGALSTGALSLVGAYLVPILLNDPNTGPFVLPVYLLVLSAAAITLAVRRPKPFGSMGILAWVGTGILGLVWSAWQFALQPWAVISFWAIVWVLHQSGWLLTAARAGVSAGPHTEIEARVPPKALRRAAKTVVLSIATTTGVIWITTLALKSQLHLPQWLAPAGAFAVTGALALVLGGHLRVLRDRPRTPIEILAASYAAQAGALLVVTVALALSGWVESTAWLAMGVGAVLAGRWIGARAVDHYGVGLLLIASTRIGAHDLLFGPAGIPWTSADAPLAIAPWTLLVAGAGACWALVAALMSWTGRDEIDRPGVIAPRPLLGIGATAMAWLAFLAMPAHPESRSAAICVCWLAYSIGLRAVDRLAPRRHLGHLAALTAGLAIYPWMTAFPPGDWLASRVPILANAGLWIGLLVTGVLGAHAWAARRDPRVEGVVSAGACLGWLTGVVALTTTSLEVARGAAMLATEPTAQRAVLSIWWGLWGLSLVVGGFIVRTTPVRYAGLGLITIAALKSVLIDLVDVPPLWRVVSFVGLGALMLFVAVLYGRVSAALDGDSEIPESDRV
ncbi:MAG: DUF2339 domain-containing protein [Phycisphaerales bacterium]|nr:DUF2339 domain-containing protein [Phycisphaerales bacterium]